MRQFGLVMFALSATLLWPGARALAIDTIETFDVGSVDVEMYLGAGEIGKDSSVFLSDSMFGFGLICGLSSYFGVSMDAAEGLQETSSTIYAGLFGTPLDTDHFDVDLMLDMQAPSSGGGARVTPGIELNFDIAPDLALAGFYVRVGIPAVGHPHGQYQRPGTKFGAEGVVGAYWTVAEDHQLLLEVDGHFEPTEDGGDKEPDLGGVALGYNVVLCDTMELVTEVFVDIPAATDDFSVSFTAGFVATLP